VVIEDILDLRRLTLFEGLAILAVECDPTQRE
jgi:hypothetical protein